MPFYLEIILIISIIVGIVISLFNSRINNYFNTKVYKFDRIKNSRKEESKIEKKEEDNESDLEFNERINKLKSQTKLSWEEELSKSVDEKRKKYFGIVDKQISEIITKLKSDIEKDAKGENIIGRPLEKLEYDIDGENNELLSLPISELFRINIKKRDTYISLENECEKFNMKVKVVPIDIGYLDPKNVHPLEPSFENYKIIIESKVLG